MLNVKIITPYGLYGEFSSKIVNCRTIDGAIGLLPNHIPIVSMLEISKLEIDTVDSREVYAISGGVIYLDDLNNVSILTDAIENARDIDIERANKAKDRAIKDLEHYSQGKEFISADIALKRALNRLSIGG